jgi:hypothetical protein
MPVWTALFIDILWQFSTACADVVLAHLLQMKIFKDYPWVLRVMCIYDDVRDTVGST